MDIQTTAKAACIHFWDITPSGLAGVCRKCQETRFYTLPKTLAEHRALHRQVTQEIEAAKKAKP